MAKTRASSAGKGDGRRDNFKAFNQSPYWDKDKQDQSPASPDPEWWGYLHANGTVQCKRWFGDHADYTTDCEGNDFVVSVVKPFRAPDQDAAFKHLRQILFN